MPRWFAKAQDRLSTRLDIQRFHLDAQTSPAWIDKAYRLE